MYRFYTILRLFLLCSILAEAQIQKGDFLVSAGGVFNFQNNKRDEDLSLMKAYESALIQDKSDRWTVWINPAYAVSGRWLLGAELSFTRTQSVENYYTWYMELSPPGHIPVSPANRVHAYYTSKIQNTILRAGPSVAWSGNLQSKTVFVLRGSIYMHYSKTIYDYRHPFSDYYNHSFKTGIGAYIKPTILYFITQRAALEITPLQLIYEQTTGENPEGYFGLNAILSPISIGLNYRL